MYEQFRNQFAMKVVDAILPKETLGEVLRCLDQIACDYDITKKETSLVPYNQDIPILVKTFIVCKKVEGLSENTLYNYTKHLQKFFFAVQKAPEQVTANDIRLYLFEYQNQTGISNRSLDKIRDCLSSFYKWMVLDGYIDKDPVAKVPKIKYESKQREACSQVELEYLRRECKTLKQKAILEVLYSTGCRVGELVVLKKSDIDWREKTVHLFGKGKKHRVGFLNAKAEVALKAYLDSRGDDNEWLFVSDRKPHNQMHASGVQKIIREMTERSNINKKVTPHIIRHTTATRMLENKADLASIQTVLGHSSINTTMIYAHNTLESVKLEHNKAVV